MKKLKSIFGFYIFCALFYASLLHADISWEKIEKGIIITGATFLGLSGLRWLFSPDKYLVEKASKLYQQAHSHYDWILCPFEQEFYTYLVNAHDTEQAINNCSEQLLDSITQKIWRTNRCVATYHTNLCTTIKQLKLFQEKLNTQIGKLSLDKCNDCHCHDMELIEQSINILLLRLTVFSNLLEHHSTYFSLYETEYTLFNKYQAELSILIDYKANDSLFVQKLKCIIFKKEKGTYPYHDYEKQLEKYIERLKNNQNLLKSHYPKRINQSQQLIDSLKHIQEIVTTDILYRQEFYAQHQELAINSLPVHRSCYHT